MSIDFAIMERARLQTEHKLPANAPFMTLAPLRFRPFMETLRASQLTCVSIQGSSIDKQVYRRELAKELRLNDPD